jgi:pre-mRNA-splicing factor ATP-dependent RNA helicase DHX15/PRP43
VFNAFKIKKESPDWCYDNFVNFRAVKQANDIREQLIGVFVKLGLKISSSATNDPNYSTNIRKSILSGFFMHTAHLEKAGHYMTLKDNQVVAIHPSTTLDHKPEWCIYNEFVLTSKNYIRTVTEINPEWLFEISPEYFDLADMPNGEAKRKLERVNRRIKEEDSE